MRKLLNLIVGTSAAAMLVPAPTAGQQISPEVYVRADTEREIVVSAESEVPEIEADEVRKQARLVTDATNVFHDSLAMFQKPLCPGVTGLPVDLATLIADRIRFNAERIGLPLAAGGECQPNFVVSFVKDGRQALRDIADKRVKALGDIEFSDRQELLGETGPVRAWHITSVRTRDGMPIQRDPYDGFEIARSQSANSLILGVSRHDIEFSTVIIDLPAIDGMSAVQIADYATIRGLAKTKPVTGDSAYGTILNLFDEQSLHPLELTAFDLGYLKAIYGSQPSIVAASKLGSVNGAMREEVAALEAEQALSE